MGRPLNILRRCLPLTPTVLLVLVSVGGGTIIRTLVPLYAISASPAATPLPMSSRPPAAQIPDYESKYPREYSLFKTFFDQGNGNLYSAERDTTFSIFTQRVEALQNVGAKISLGGMLSLLIYESGAHFGWFNTLCAENDYAHQFGWSTNCWEHPEARYSYQFGVGAVHTSNFHPCKNIKWTRPQRQKFATLVSQAGFSLTPEQVASTASELHTFCPESTQPEAVDYYILMAHTYGIPTNLKGNLTGNKSLITKLHPFFSPTISVEFFFSSLEAQPSHLTSDAQAICIWGGGDPTKSPYCTSQKQSAILALWNQFTARSTLKEVVVAGFQSIPTPSRGTFQFGRDAFYLVPTLVYDGSRYKLFPHDFPDEDPMVHHLTGQDFLGQSANPNSPRVKELLDKSILSRVKQFDVYRKGRKIGTFTVRNLVYIGPIGQVVGIGVANGFTPGHEDIAIAGAPVQTDFWLLPSSLSSAQMRELETIVTGLFPKTIPANQTAPNGAAQPLRLKTTWQDINVLDPERNGNIVVCLERKAAVTSIAPVSLSARSFLLARYNSQTRSFNKLASWAIIVEGQKTVFLNGTGDEIYSTFKNALDLNGDGIPELILLRGISGGSPMLLVYQFQDGKINTVGIRAWEIGFELTVPETVSGLYGTD